MTSMTIAELYGKISSLGANVTDTSEDLLTSDVFGCIRYVRPDSGLVQFLETAKAFSGETLSVPRPIMRVHWSFWPSIRFPRRKPCEPDVVIGFETPSGIHIVMVEAKYLSGKSSYEDEDERPNDQLARELDNLELLGPNDLEWNTTKEVIGRSLLYLTQDASIPSHTIQESLKEYRRKRKQHGKIYWTSWRHLSLVLEKENQHLDEYQSIVIEDIRRLLEKKGLTMFRGMTPMTTTFERRTYTFYSFSPNRYYWPDIPSSLWSLPPYAYVGGRR